jgi:pyruvate dehydrogenase E1 component
VVHIVTMGALVTEALEASDLLLKKGIYANVLVCTSPDLLLGNQAHVDGYRHLKETLGVTGALHVTRKRQNGQVRYDLQTRADLVEAAAGRIPVVSVADGEVGMLDNLGSIVGTRHEALGTRKASKCGRPIDVYRLHHLDGESVAESAQQVLAETALEQVVVSRALLADVAGRGLVSAPSDWRESWGAEG